MGETRLREHAIQNPEHQAAALRQIAAVTRYAMIGDSTGRVIACDITTGASIQPGARIDAEPDQWVRWSDLVPLLRTVIR